MQISGMSLTLTWPLRLCLLRILLGATPTATRFPLSKHTGGGDIAPALSGLLVYLQFTWEVGLPPSPVDFSSHHHVYKLSRSWLLGLCRHSCFSSRLVLRDFPFPLFSSQDAPPTLLCVFFVVIAYYSVFFFFFSWVGGRSVQGAMLIWPRVVCGSLAHLVDRVFPSHLGTGVWWRHGSPPGFYI
jgi:hypothetical protein